VTALLAPSLAELDFEPEILCVSHKFCHPHDHPATWWITLSCGCPYPMCERALRMANLRLKVRPLTCRLCRCDQIAIRSVVRI
jgi:hypothetical protein